ncbi:MAG: aa3-type cytochrome c oxidase subunit IV [Alphaproteobacteria bacterium]
MAVEHDMRPHQEMWTNFTKLVVKSIIGIIALLVFMALLLL